MTLDTTLLVLRALTVLGVVLSGGVFAFWCFVWPSGRRDRVPVLVALGGLALVAVASLGQVLAPWLSGGVDLVRSLASDEGIAGLVQLALVSALAGFFTDLVAADTRRWRAVVLLALVSGLLVGVAAPAGSFTSGGIALVAGVAAGCGALVVWGGGLLALWVTRRTAPAVVPVEHVSRLAGVAVALAGVAALGHTLRGPGDGVLGQVPTVVVLSLAAVAVAVIVVSAWWVERGHHRARALREEAAATPGPTGPPVIAPPVIAPQPAPRVRVPVPSPVAPVSKASPPRGPKSTSSAR